MKLVQGRAWENSVETGSVNGTKIEMYGKEKIISKRFALNATHRRP
jgi:hypothetical protein